jgi:hypothetical protein
LFTTPVSLTAMSACHSASTCFSSRCGKLPSVFLVEPSPCNFYVIFHTESRACAVLSFHSRLLHIATHVPSTPRTSRRLDGLCNNLAMPTVKESKTVVSHQATRYPLLAEAEWSPACTGSNLWIKITLWSLHTLAHDQRLFMHQYS